MNEIVAIVEGETERTFVRNVVAPHLSSLGLTMWAVLSGKRGNVGGVKRWPSARKDIANVLNQRRYCTCMFDYYGMPPDWPGRKEAPSRALAQRGAFVERRIKAALKSEMGQAFDPRQLIPYVQMHEFEALLFADPAVLARGVAPLAKTSVKGSEENLGQRFQEILDESCDPEAINDDYETCPSRRIKSLVPAYSKAINGPIIAERIGLDTLRARCRHFATWLSRLEAIAGQ